MRYESRMFHKANSFKNEFQTINTFLCYSVMSGLGSISDGQFFAKRKKCTLCTLTFLINYKICAKEWKAAGIYVFKFLQLKHQNLFSYIKISFYSECNSSTQARCFYLSDYIKHSIIVVEHILGVLCFTLNRTLQFTYKYIMIQYLTLIFSDATKILKSLHTPGLYHCSSFPNPKEYCHF